MMIGSRFGVSRRGVLRWGVGGLAAVAGAPLLAKRGEAASEPLQALYARARAEGALNLYAAGYSAFHAPWARAFGAAFPGVTVNGTSGFGRVLVGAVDAQRTASKIETDLVILDTVQDLARWKRDGALVEFRPDGFDAVPEGFKDPDATSIAVGVYGLGCGYNRNALPDARVPQRASDFLDPAFRGRIVSSYPQDEDSTLYLYSLLLEKYGWRFMDELKGNQPRFVRGHWGVAQQLGTGPAVVTFDGALNLVLDLRAIGVPAEIMVSQVDPLPVWPQMAAILKGCPHPNAAMLYLTWFLAPTQQTQIGTWSARRDLPPPPGLKPLADHVLASGYREFAADEAKLADLRTRLSAYTGPVEGAPIT